MRDPEIRWGDVADWDVAIPAAFAGDLRSPLRQLIDLRAENRAWLVALGIVWDDPGNADPGDTLVGEYAIQYGAGSARIGTLRAITITQPAGLIFPFGDLIEQLPGDTITVQVRARVIAVAGPARAARGKLSAMVAPVTRS